LGKYFLNFNDAELYAISVWVANVKTKNQWNGFVGKVWDAYMAEYDKQTEQSAEETQPQERQSVH
jgi:hypothetical protein